MDVSAGLKTIDTIEELESLYGAPGEASTTKVHFQCARTVPRSELWNPGSMSIRRTCRRRAISSTP